ncbi:MAG: hypothetical protein JWQ02_602 [Capsulimonas sp.]|nr:hypothetical protein [Capsulimonas sp.]
MIPLQQIEIASPCHASWSEMDGEGAVRFCGQCRRNVYNLSEMTTAEAQALVTQTEGKLCVRFYKRKDGTMMTKDCPVGVRVARRKYVTALSWAASLAVASIVGTTRPANAADPVAVSAMMGDFVAPPAKVKAVAPVAVHKVVPKVAVKKRPHIQTTHPTMGRVASPRITPRLSAMMGTPLAPPPSKTPLSTMGKMARPSQSTDPSMRGLVGEITVTPKK